jgi:hypothetical protein
MNGSGRYSDEKRLANTVNSIPPIATPSIASPYVTP